ncbi:hypothetical protein CBS101457_004143 [Exobasidium rhododendri]|nr:hypothetical protein CBS101457_004143 [Exobasidium rhododendri]
MYSHSRSFAPHPQSSHSTTPAFLSSHYSHQPPPPSSSSHPHHNPRGTSSSTSHHHVLQNPPQSSTVASQFAPQSPSSPTRTHYQPFYPNVIPVNDNQDAWDGITNVESVGGASVNTHGHSHVHEGTSSSGQVGHGSGSINNSRTSFGHSVNFSPSSRPRNLAQLPRAESSSNVTSNSSRSATAASKQSEQDVRFIKTKAGSSSSGGGGGGSGGGGPNWGLIGRQLSQIAGDVSTSVRQNELVISLLERLVERVETTPGPVLQGDCSRRGRTDLSEQSDSERGDNTTLNTRFNSRRQDGYPSAEETATPSNHHEQQHIYETRNQTDPPTPTSAVAPTNVQAESSNANGTQTSVPYLADHMNSHSYDFVPVSQSDQNRIHYTAPLSHSYDADSRSRKTPPRVPYLLNGHQTNAGQASHSTPTHMLSTATDSTSRYQPTSNVQGGVNENTVTEDETYNRIPSPVFPDTAPADDGPSSALDFAQYYAQGDNVESRSNRNQIAHRRPQDSPPLPSSVNHTMHVLNLTQQQERHQQSSKMPSSITSARQREPSHVSAAQAVGFGSLEGAGVVIPVSSTSSSSVTPASRPNTAARTTGDGVHGDRSMASGMGDMTEEDGGVGGDGGNNDDANEPANDLWKLWLQPKESHQRKEIPRAKYRSAKQVKQERKDKTKRSMSTIGRIPLKEYLEVGPDYKLVRREARSVYNMWLALNIRLAKQDPERLMACYHKLEYEYPILADCEDHWKAKELMLQVIDNAIDEIAFHRRREERKARQISERRGRMDALELDPRTGERRNASSAGLYSTEETRPSTRRKKGTTASNPSDKRNSDEEVNEIFTSSQQKEKPQPQPPHQEHQQQQTSSSSGNASEPHMSVYEQAGLLPRPSAQRLTPQQGSLPAPPPPAPTPQQQQKQQQQQQQQDWTHAGENANLFARSQSFSDQQQPIPGRSTARKNAQIHSHGW